MARTSRPKRTTQKEAGFASVAPTEEGELVVIDRPPHRIGVVDGKLYFTPSQRERVREMAQYGVPFKSICQHILNPNTGKPIDRSTLADSFRDELDAGMAIADHAIAKTSFMQAVGMPAEYDEAGKLLREEVPAVPMMTKWLTQSRLGFKDTVVVENSVSALDAEAIGKAFANLSYEDLIKVREIAKRTREGGDSES